jgi:REP element-mobilizing transposase RayT
MPLHKHLRRLDRVWIPNAVYFVTACTQDRRPILAGEQAAAVLRQEWASAAARHSWLIGRYVIMPDHVHFFCTAADDVAGVADPGLPAGHDLPASAKPATGAESLANFMRAWKQWTAKRLKRELGFNVPLWQAEFFDHVLRSDESYAEKWAYVRENPVRAKLVARWEDWPWQGFVDFDSPLG